MEFRTEPLDAIVERRLKAIWDQAPCPECGATAIRTWDDLDRIWCRGCDLMSTYTRGPPFYDAELAPGEFLVAFILYADSLLSINQIASLLQRAYNTARRFVTWKPRSSAASPAVWDRIDHTLDGPAQVDETQQVCSGFKGRDPPRDGLSRGGSPEGGRTRWSGEQGDEMTLVAACRDVLRVISAEEGTRFDDELKPVIEEAEALSQQLGEVWTDAYPPYQQLERDHRTVVHDERYVSEEGVHTNQAECLWSLLEP